MVLNMKLLKMYKTFNRDAGWDNSERDHKEN